MLFASFVLLSVFPPFLILGFHPLKLSQFLLEHMPWKQKLVSLWVWFPLIAGDFSPYSSTSLFRCPNEVQLYWFSFKNSHNFPVCFFQTLFKSVNTLTLRLLSFVHFPPVPVTSFSTSQFNRVGEICSSIFFTFPTHPISFAYILLFSIQCLCLFENIKIIFQYLFFSVLHLSTLFKVLQESF